MALSHLGGKYTLEITDRAGNFIQAVPVTDTPPNFEEAVVVAKALVKHKLKHSPELIYTLHWEGQYLRSQRTLQFP